MSNNQHQLTNPYYTTADRANDKFKFVIFGLIAAAIIGLLLFIIFFISKNQSGNAFPSGRENTATLQMYAALDDEIPVENIESAVKAINSEAVVSIEDGYGTIRIPSEDKEFISFTFVTEEEASTASDEPLEEDGIAEKTYSPNIAYSFAFVYPIDAEDAITISYSDQGIFYYYDGLDVYEFPSRQEAIDAYLAPVL